MPSAPTILIADDDPAICTILEEALREEGFSPLCFHSGAALLEQVKAGAGDAVITDILMPNESGLDLLPRIHALRPQMPVLVMSAQSTLSNTVTANQRGAYEFIPKPFDLDDIINTLKQCIKNQDNLAGNKSYPQPSQSELLVGQSSKMQEVYRTLARVVDLDLTVLIVGESGTGKEMVARALHSLGSRKDEPFVAVNMAAIPRDLMESELFGHEKGAFTGAVSRKSGRFAQAQRGTLFLDEIGDMPLEAQTRLLRVLQEGEYTPVGGSQTLKSFCRIVCATHQNLAELVKQGRFREDLYYRLQVVPVHVPALRNRAEDIPALVDHFMARAQERGIPHKQCSESALAFLQALPWHGNVRELEHVLYRACALTTDSVLTPSAFEKVLPHAASVPSGAGDAALLNSIPELLDEHLKQFFAAHAADDTIHSLYENWMGTVEPPLLKATLSFTKGNQVKAAQVLGINRNTLRKKLQQYGLLADGK